MRKFFIFSMIVTGSIALLYTGWLINTIENGRYQSFYLYIRFFLVGWVLSSVILAFIGDSRRIGGIKSFLISLFNPALGLIMVLASDSKENKETSHKKSIHKGTTPKETTHAIKKMANTDIPERSNNNKKIIYTLNT